MTIHQFENQMNEWGRMKVPFLFIVDFECHQPMLLKLYEVNDQQVLYNFNGFNNSAELKSGDVSLLNVNPVTFAEYKIKFDQVMAHLERGDSFLTNLTFRSAINNSLDLTSYFNAAQAKYKMWMSDQFLFFSPETFIQIEDGLIKTFPMKGTIDSSIPNAQDLILNDEKEMAEHITIVDLLRNDLSLVSTSVEVKRFRYIDHIKTPTKSILQVSSEITGRLKAEYENSLGSILVKLLPAGSICGAPKKKTVEIISQVEGETRGYYTGVAGYFDGNKLDSCVMIRFIEQQNSKYYYRSGGGITSRSLVEKEYQEMINKIYVPVN